MSSARSIQAEFAAHITKVLKEDNNVIGLAVGGSWLSGEIDEFSDLDLILVTKEKISESKDKMLAYAGRFGRLLSAFTGEHVGDPRVLICLYDELLLHVDIKFLTLGEFEKRVENPVILMDSGGQLEGIINSTESKFPLPNYQWIEDRFWVWIHYALLKIGRGEHFEAFDFFGSLRNIVLGPLIHMKAKSEPRGVRKIEIRTDKEYTELLKATLPDYDKKSLMLALKNSVELYRTLRKELYSNDVTLRAEAEKRVMMYYDEITGTDN